MNMYLAKARNKYENDIGRDVRRNFQEVCQSQGGSDSSTEMRKGAHDDMLMDSNFEESNKLKRQLGKPKIIVTSPDFFSNIEEI